MTVSSGIFTTFKPESYLPRFAYFPLFIRPEPQVLTLDKVQLEIDTEGRASIIRLVDKDGRRITPFIDLSKYDSDVKNWFIYRDEGDTPGYRLPYRYAGTTVTNMYPSDIGPQLDFKVKSTEFINNEIKITGSGVLNQDYEFYKYAPIILVANTVPFTDLTDYVNITTSASLSTSSTTFEFYYDFEERLHTNQNLAGFAANDVKIIFSLIGDNSVKVKCVLSANSGSRPNQTPIVDDYILKLKGQYLRG